MLSGKGLDWHMVGVGHWVLLLLLSVITCSLPAPAHKEEKQSSSQLQFGKAQAVTLSVSAGRLVGKASV